MTVQSKPWKRVYSEFDDADKFKKRIKYTIFNEPTRLESYVLQHSMSELEKGHAVMDHIRRLLIKLDEHCMRSADQIIMCDLDIASVIPFVYRKCFASNEKEILEYNNITAVWLAIALSMPRRFGKSVILNTLLAVYMVCIPHFEGIIISQSVESAGINGILGKVKDTLENVLGVKTIKVSNKEHITIFMPDARKLHAYSKGKGDRYSFFQRYVFYNLLNGHCSFFLVARIHLQTGRLGNNRRQVESWKRV